MDKVMSREENKKENKKENKRIAVNSDWKASTR